MTLGNKSVLYNLTEDLVLSADNNSFKLGNGFRLFNFTKDLVPDVETESAIVQLNNSVELGNRSGLYNLTKDVVLVLSVKTEVSHRSANNSFKLDN